MQQNLDETRRQKTTSCKHKMRRILLDENANFSQERARAGRQGAAVRHRPGSFSQPAGRPDPVQAVLLLRVRPHRRQLARRKFIVTHGPSSLPTVGYVLVDCQVFDLLFHLF